MRRETSSPWSRTALSKWARTAMQTSDSNASHISSANFLNVLCQTLSRRSSRTSKNTESSRTTRQFCWCERSQSTMPISMTARPPIRISVLTAQSRSKRDGGNYSTTWPQSWLAIEEYARVRPARGSRPMESEREARRMEKPQVDMPQVDIDRVFHALGDPTRRAIVERLSERPHSVSSLAAPLGISLTAVGQHLQILEEGGPVGTEKIGRVRTCAPRAAG